MPDDSTNRPQPPQGVSPADPRTIISKQPPLATALHGRPVPPHELAKQLVGQRLDHFDIQEFVGGGGMGAVFRALDSRLDRIVALKVLAREHAVDEETVRRFRNEAQSAARLDHDHIARVFYVGEDAGCHFIAYEFIEGINLRDLVERRGPLPLNDAVQYTLQVADALTHASSRDVIHRDIKPSNVLITPRGVAKLVDMGLARLHHVDQPGDDLTASGVTLGTFDYISPEQARDPRNADVRSDLYSLGCTLYYMLTARPPFPDGTVLQKLLRHQGDEPVDPRRLQPGIPPQIAHIVLRMLAKDPRHRYQTPGDLVDDLLRAGQELGLSASHPAPMLPATEGPAFFSWVRHLPWMAPVGVLLAVVLFVHFTSTSDDLADAPSVTTAQTLPTLPPARPPATETRASHPPRASEATDLAKSPPKLAPKPTNPPSTTAPDPREAPPETQSDSPRPAANTPQREGNPPQRATNPLRRDGNRPQPDSDPPQPDTGVAGTSDPPQSAKSTAAAAAKPPRRAPPSDMPQSGALALEGLAAALNISDPVAASLSAATPTTLAAREGGGEAAAARTPVGDRAAGLLVVRQPGDAQQDDADPADAESTFSTLRAACAAAHDGDIIELRYDGPCVERPFQLDNVDLTVRAGEGFSPTVVFKPQPGNGNRMISMVGGRLVLVRVGIELDLPMGEVPSDNWTLLAVEGSQLVQLEQCVLTVNNLGPGGGPHHMDVTMIDVIGQTAAALAPPTGMGETTVELRLENCVARGEATFLRVSDAQPTLLQWSNGLLATSERLLSARGAQRAPDAAAQIRLDLQHLTIDAEEGLLLLSSSEMAPFQLPTMVTCTNTLVRSATDAAMIEQIGLDTPAELRELVGWKGDRNFFEGLSSFWRMRRPDSMQSVRDSPWSDWKSFWGGGRERWGPLGWLLSPTGEVPMHARTPADYALPEPSPARNATADLIDAGLEPAELPPEALYNQRSPAAVLPSPSSGPSSSPRPANDTQPLP